MTTRTPSYTLVEHDRIAGTRLLESKLRGLEDRITSDLVCSTIQGFGLSGAA